MRKEKTPFHFGELEAQRRAGKLETAAATGDFIRDHMPGQHREFFAALPFLVVASGDKQGRTWVTILESESGFVTSPDPHSLDIAAQLPAEDPLTASFTQGALVGILGMEPATRRRNRVNGRLRNAGNRLRVDVHQSFGNCPQYIRERQWRRIEQGARPTPRISESLDTSQRMRIKAADTFFIGSGDRGIGGYDASHRGGEPGFIHISDQGVICIPDYAGNNYFNTIGNLLRNPQAGLLFVDFETGGLLHVSGQARLNWDPENSHDSNARRMIEIVVDRVVDRPNALALRWYQHNEDVLQLRVVDRIDEAADIISICFANANGKSLERFVAGQHLSIELKVPDQPGLVRRSYSLSGSPNAETYRISVKREARGIMSNFIHDRLQPGNLIEARVPSGDFVIPSGKSPLVLVSAGIGITPMLAMLHSIVAGQSDRPVWFVHGARNGREAGFRAEIKSLLAADPRIVCKIFYSKPDAQDISTNTFDLQGRIKSETLLAFNAGQDAHYMLCGPASLIADLQAGLIDAGVPSNQIHFETFGPSG